MSETGSRNRNIIGEISNIVEILSSKLKTANEDFLESETQLKTASEEILRLRATINALKQKQCSKCQKYYDCIMILKKKLKVKDNTITILTKILSKRDEDSYNMASQMVNDVLNQERTPEKEVNRNTDEVTSPLVLKTARRSKRKLDITIDNEQENENFLFTSNPRKTPEKEGCLSKDIVPLHLASPEILRDVKITKVDGLVTNREIDKENVVMVTSSSYDVKCNSTSKNEMAKICCSLNANNNQNTSVSMGEKMKTSFSSDIKNDTIRNEKIAEGEPACDNSNSKEPEKSKTKWQLKKSRILSSEDKLKQTVLSTAVFEKKVDLSTLENYNGGCAPPLAKKLDIITTKSPSLPCKENTNETFFEPLVTSTVIEPNSVAKVEGSPAKNSPSKSTLVESTNKDQLVHTPVKTDDSFDFIPSTSPRYKYKRDAVRKKSERLKLPGQDCDQCFKFYEAMKDEMSGSQIQKLLNKCSRHRDKYPVRLNTPPGLWNPVFDDTDKENEVK